MQKNYQLIDCHVHIFPDAIAERSISKLQHISGLTPYTDGTLVDTRKKLADAGIDGYVLLNVATSPKQENTINNTAKEMNCDKVAALGSVHPLDTDFEKELERIKELGLKGIKFHPDYQEFMIDDEKLFPIYEKCASLGLTVVFHAGFDPLSPELVHAPPERSRRVIDNFPKLKILLAHFGGMKMWDEVDEFIIGQDVYLDTAMCATYADKAQIERMILKHDSDKILFGSDCPWENPKKTFELIDSMALSDDLKEKIFSKNAIRLYGIKL